MATTSFEIGSEQKIPTVAQDKPMHAFEDEILDLEFDRDPAKKWATVHDLQDMNVLGLAPTFRRRFKFLAMVGFSSTVVLAWQATLAGFGFGLYNGGTGGMFFTFIYSLIALGIIYLSLAELSSCFPTAGGQYQWVAECAPSPFRRPLAYCTGWLCTTAWVTFLAGGGVITGNTIKALCLLYFPDSPAFNSQWFPTILGMAALTCGGLSNAYLATKVPLIESIMLCIHVASWAAVVVTLWVLSPRAEAREVLLTFNNGGDWSTSAASALIGVITPWVALMGYDSSVHMTENVQDASLTIPWSLMTAYAGNATMAFLAAITLIFCLGDLDTVLDTPTGMPYIQVFLDSTGSRGATVALTVPILLVTVSALISELATASRQLWSFARDGGLPFAARLKEVHDAEAPRRAVFVTTVVTFIPVAVNFGSAIGFNIITSLVVTTLTFSYTITTACVIYRRFSGRPLPRARFSLGRLGLPINLAALAMVLPVLVFAAFPPDRVVKPVTMNWASVIFSGVVILATVCYFLVGRHHFDPPMRKDE